MVDPSNTPAKSNAAIRPIVVCLLILGLMAVVFTITLLALGFRLGPPAATPLNGVQADALRLQHGFDAILRILDLAKITLLCCLAVAGFLFLVSRGRISAPRLQRFLLSPLQQLAKPAEEAQEKDQP